MKMAQVLVKVFAIKGIIVGLTSGSIIVISKKSL
jgi:hypothetical protein